MSDLFGIEFYALSRCNPPVFVYVWRWWYYVNITPFQGCVALASVYVGLTPHAMVLSPFQGLNAISSFYPGLAAGYDRNPVLCLKDISICSTPNKISWCCMQY